ncbi:MAG TPA: TfoX/Sxy family protein [Burkholderiales bacterium]|jgi:DNA transformation protein|nr:TfoX/Sxy family protein [Burkholderiales bacterium]
MPKSREFVETVCERLAPLGRVRARTMFGGWGIYVDGRFCAIVHRGALYFKVDKTSRREFEAKGLQPFKPFPDQAMVMSYYDAPPEVFEDPAEMLAWGRKALEAALRSQKKKPAGRRKR